MEEGRSVFKILTGKPRKETNCRPKPRRRRGKCLTDYTKKLSKRGFGSV